MNITAHCQMRYLQREYSEYIINDATFVIWKRTNPDAIPKAEKEISKIFAEADETISSTDNKGVVSNYKINTKENWIFVYDANILITMYEIKYSLGISKEASSTIFNILLNEYKIFSEKTKIETLKKTEENVVLQINIENTEQNIKILRQQLELLEQFKKMESENMKLNLIKIVNLKNETDNIALKIVKPQNFI